VLDQRGELKQIGGIAKINELSLVMLNTDSVAYYARAIAEKAALRRFMLASATLAKKAIEGQDPTALIAEAQAHIKDIASCLKRKEPKTLEDHTLDHYLSMESGGEEMRGYSTGFKSIDRYTQGLTHGQLVIIGGRPGTGKTAFALETMRSTLTQGAHCIFFSLEMSQQSLLNRVYSALSQIPMGRVKTGLGPHAPMHLWDAYHKAREDFETITGGHQRLEIVDQIVTIEDIRERVIKAKEAGPLDAIFVDYLGLIPRSPNVPKSAQREREVAYNMAGLKAIATEQNVLIFILSQLNRAMAARADKRPTMTDLRESGSIEQDADIILLLYSDEQALNKIEVNVAKNRNGETGQVELLFKRDTQNFFELKTSFNPFSSKGPQ
jgi:replicative DNA helicase